MSIVHAKALTAGGIRATQSLSKRICQGGDLMEQQPTVTLYRPVGQKELDLIRASGWRAFPPRLPFRPIFYRF